MFLEIATDLLFWINISTTKIQKLQATIRRLYLFLLGSQLGVIRSADAAEFSLRTKRLTCGYFSDFGLMPNSTGELQRRRFSASY